ncbi:MAG TPA: hypothetical protein VLA19_17790 [Herpetosiphonaceae bacterium]|nr:hypothetical protein [Herpetosiphonaceae bacterium]
MTTTPASSTSALPDIEVLLARLKALRHEIAEMRDTLAPLEANLAAAEREYQDHLRPLRRELARVQAHINELQERLEADVDTQAVVRDGNAVDQASVGGTSDGKALLAHGTSPRDDEAIVKDQLLEHVYRMLDPMMNPSDAELVGQLQGLCTDPLVRLADVLEQITWGPVWEQRSAQESAVMQCQRLHRWEEALSDQLSLLRRGADRLRRDGRYRLALERDRGTAAWAAFLEQEAREYHTDIDDLRQQLTALQERWARLIGST